MELANVRDKENESNLVKFISNTRESIRGKYNQSIDLKGSWKETWSNHLSENTKTLVNKLIDSTK